MTHSQRLQAAIKRNPALIHTAVDHPHLPLQRVYVAQLRVVAEEEIAPRKVYGRVLSADPEREAKRIAIAEAMEATELDQEPVRYVHAKSKPFPVEGAPSHDRRWFWEEAPMRLEARPEGFVRRKAMRKGVTWDQWNAMSAEDKARNVMTYNNRVQS